MLLIINESLYDKYSRSHLTPKEFVKENIFLNKERYDCSTMWVTKYFERLSNNELSLLFKEYDKKRKNAHKGEKTISELIKD